jgi:hypothetical protein
MIRSCPILVLATVPGRPRRNDVKNGLKNYQVPTTYQENAIRNIPGCLPKFPQYVFLNFSVIMT